MDFLIDDMKADDGTVNVSPLLPALRHAIDPIPLSSAPLSAKATAIRAKSSVTQSGSTTSSGLSRICSPNEELSLPTRVLASLGYRFGRRMIG